MSRELIILIGSMSGTAEMVAEELSECDAVQESNLKVKLLPMDKADLTVFDQDAVFLYCTSTYGTGDPPDNAVEFHRALVNTRPNLGSVRYAIVGLGDQKYADTFCGGPKLFEAAMQACRAQRVADMCLLNASSGQYPEEVAIEWLTQWLPGELV